MKKRPPQAEKATPRDPLSGKRVVLCLTGGIAVYKSVYLTRALVKAGARVVVIMTDAAQRFVAPLTFETLSGNRVVTSTFERVFSLGGVEHIDLAEWADLVLVAPATYNFLGKLNAGVADDAVTTFVTAVTSPVFIAPAMNEHMWRNPINQRNVKALRELGYHLIDPGRGGLACSWEGEGRMQEPEEILEAVRNRLREAAEGDSGSEPSRTSGVDPLARGSSGEGHSQPMPPPSVPAGLLVGRTLLVTAAGTHEPIDPVRFVGNRSSGRMGYALATEAARRGARVLLVSGPSRLQPPVGLAGFRLVESADDMLRAVEEWLEECDVLVMAAAVADYRPRQASTSKIKRSSTAMQLDLEPTPDILLQLRPRKEQRLFVGFALETEVAEAEIRRKLEVKGLDLIVANRVGPETGPDSETNQVWIYGGRGLIQETPVLDKGLIAAAILNVVEAELLHRSQHAGA